MQNVNYTFINNEGNFVFRSNVNSFGLDHVTDKDVTSFYTNFSSSSYFDHLFLESCFERISV